MSENSETHFSFNTFFLSLLLFRLRDVFQERTDLSMLRSVRRSRVGADRLVADIWSGWRVLPSFRVCAYGCW